MRRNRLPIIPVVRTRDDRIETVVIERVEEFAAKLESGTISDLDLFDRGKAQQAKIEIHNRRRGDDRAFQFLAVHQNWERINRSASAATKCLFADILPPKKEF
jgi:hypothetical protein